MSNYFCFCETSFHYAGFQTGVPESYYVFAENDPGKDPKAESQEFTKSSPKSYSLPWKNRTML